MFGHPMYPGWEELLDPEEQEKRKVCERFAKWKKKIHSNEILYAFEGYEQDWIKWGKEWSCLSHCENYRLVFRETTATLYCY